MNAVPFPLGAPRAHAHAEYRAAGRDSLAELVERHTALVSRLAHHLCARLPANVDVGDLVQAGMIGLIEASRSYDAAQGASFETYASIRIRGAMLDEVRKGDWMPRSVHRRAREAAEGGVKRARAPFGERVDAFAVAGGVVRFDRMQGAGEQFDDARGVFDRHGRDGSGGVHAAASRRSKILVSFSSSVFAVNGLMM